MIKFLFSSLNVWFFVAIVVMSACTSTRIRYEQQMPDGTIQSVDQSFDTTHHSLACHFTFGFYGGWCWRYVFFPSPFQKSEIRRTAKLFLDRGAKSQEIFRLGEEKAKPIELYRSDYSEEQLEQWNDEKIKVSEQDPPLSLRLVSFSNASVFGTVESSSKDVARGSSVGSTQEFSFRYFRPGFRWTVEPYFKRQAMVINDKTPKYRNPSLNNGENIPYIETDYETGEVIEELFLNSYEWSTDASGFRTGFRYVFGNYPDDLLFYRWNCCGPLLLYEARFFLNPVVYRASQTKTAQRTLEHQGWSYFDTLGYGLSMHYLNRSIQSMFSIDIDYENSLKPISLGGEVEFRNAYEYNSEIDAFQRRRETINQISARETILQLRYSYVW